MGSRNKDGGREREREEVVVAMEVEKEEGNDAEKAEGSESTKKWQVLSNYLAFKKLTAPTQLYASSVVSEGGADLLEDRKESEKMYGFNFDLSKERRSDQ